MAAAEGMACGLPVVAYALPIYDEIYPGGMLKAKAGDINGLAKLILNLLSDNSLRERISCQARETSLAFSWDKTARQILERLN
jgi:glycosyltransferase involved in cell wall biosynthesis